MSTPDKEPIPESELISRMICAQYGTAEQSDLISRHMKDYFARWPNYYPRLTDLEWYHLFLDFSDAVNRHLSSQQKAAPGMRVKDNSGKTFEVQKYIKDAEGVEHIWCNDWYGHHGIGHDCEWASEETPSVHPSAGPSERELHLRSIIERADRYLREMNDGNVHDPGVGLYLDNHLIQLITDIEELPNCYPEGGEGEEKPNLKDAITWLHHHAQRNGSQAESNAEEVYYQGYVDGLNELAKEMELSATEPAPEAQPIADNPDVSDINVGDMSQASVNELADGKEVPDHVMEFIGKRALKEAALHFHPIYSPDQNTACVICYTNGGRDIYRATRSEMVGSIQAGQIEASFRDKIIEELKADLLAARDKNNEDGIEIARLLAELKRSQENLTAMIAEALQKSKRLDEVEKEAGEYRGLLKLLTMGWWTIPEDLQKQAGELMKKFNSPTQNPDK